MRKVSRRKFLAVAGGTLAVAAGCSPQNQSAGKIVEQNERPSAISDISMEDVDPHPPELATTQPGERPRLNYQRIRPVEFKGDLPNPHLGTQTFQGFNGDPSFRTDDAHGPVVFLKYVGDLKNPNYPDTTVSYCRWVWSVLEPDKGDYQWQIIDGALHTAAQRGQTLHIRLQPFVLGGGPMPQWYWNEARSAYQDEPDSNSPAYVEHFGNLIREFGKRYDGHPTLEAFDIAYAGQFGEAGGNASPQTSARLVDIYAQSLPRTQLIAMMGTYGCIYAMKLKRPIGWRMDCYGDLRAPSPGDHSPELVWNHMMDWAPRAVAQSHAQEHWKIAPVVLEPYITVANWLSGKFDIDWILEQGLKYHPTFLMNKSDPIPDAIWDKFMAFNRKLGYRFVLRQFDLPQKAAAGEPIRLSVWIDNVGVAPIYRPYRLALRYTQEDLVKIVPFAADIRKWTPDNHWIIEHNPVPMELKPGMAQIDMGIIDEANQPKVKLAIEGVGADGWHPMCAIEIV